MQLGLELKAKRFYPNRTFRSDKNALVEQLDGNEFIYGHWDRHFGCWIRDAKTGVVTECIPDWPFLDDAGHGRDPGVYKRSKYPARAAARRLTQADAAFFSYFNNIPHVLRRLVSPLGRFQWLALDIIHRDPQFAEFLDSLHAMRQLNYLYVAFSLAEEMKLSRHARHRFGVDLRSKKRATFLNDITQLTGIQHVGPWTEHRVKLLYRLGGWLLCIDDVRLFFELTSNSQTSLYASHAEGFTLAALQMFEALRRNCPRNLRLPNLLTIVSDYWEFMLIPEVIDNAAQSLPPQKLEQLYRRLAQVSCDGALCDWLDALGEELAFNAIRSQTFPKSPIPSAKNLIPIDTPEKLEAEARRMRNCLRTKASSIIEGEAYYFHWHGVEEATIEICRNGRGEWGLAEALGRANQPLSFRAREEIENYVIEQLEPGFQLLQPV